MLEIKELLKKAIAHSRSENSRQPQSLEAHLNGVKKLAQEFAEPIGLQEAGKLAAQWHDLGKISDEFQKYIENNGKGYRSVDHKGLGTVWAYQKGWFDVALAIAGHHGGLQSLTELKNYRLPEWTKNNEQWLERFETSSHDILKSSTPEYGHITNPYAFDLRVRMLFSCLVDADFLDTEQHFDWKKENRGYNQGLDKLAESFFFYQNEKRQEASDKTDKNEKLFKLRCDLYDEVVSKAKQQLGIYSMTIPTGGGKTRTALGFALTHALKNSQQRIIVALPYTSILDQMASEYRKIFREENFLEHHTGWQAKESQEFDVLNERTRLASENWDAPIILTTTVQLFDSLFSNKTSDCRKLHNIANSVIVLDEVQTLPVKYLEPICELLTELVRNYKVTVLLSTATQPALDRVKFFNAPDIKITELITDKQNAFTILKRVKYKIDVETKRTWESVRDELLQSKRGMVIVNTKKHAVELFECVREKDETALHLSTFMCGAHRRKVIEEVKNRLSSKDKKPCRLISTQVVEAGVDLDFPLVMRAVAPLDRIVQAAGRCNREMKLKERGKVIVFVPEEDTKLDDFYEIGKQTFTSIYNRKNINHHKICLDHPEIIELYFSELYRKMNNKLDVFCINEMRESFLGDDGVLEGVLDFPKICDKFQLIEKQFHELDVLVAYNSIEKEHLWESSKTNELLIDLAKLNENMHQKTFAERRDIFRKLQSYIVKTSKNDIKEQLAQGLVLFDEKSDKHLWIYMEYENDVGIARKKIKRNIGNL